MKLLSAPSLNKTVSVLPKLSLNENSHPIPNIQMPEEDTQPRIEEFVDEASAKFYLYDEEEEHKQASNALGELMEIKHLHDSAQKTPNSLISCLARNHQAKAKTNEINKLKSEIIDLYNKSSSASGSGSSDTFVSSLGKQIKELDELCGRNKEKLESLESKRKNKFLLNELEGLLNDSNKLNVENRKTASSMSAIKFKLDQVNISAADESKRKNFNLFNSSKLTSPDMSELIKKLDTEPDQNEAIDNEGESDSEPKSERTLQKNVYISNFDKILIKKTHEEPDDECYVRGRGRGKFLCVECGIRKRKLCELKKHLFTHAKYRPFMCTRCCVSFKTKGNLVKVKKLILSQN
jgi:hypothetical protein